MAVTELARPMDRRDGEFFTGKSPLIGEASFPMLLYTSRRLPHFNVSGGSDADDSAEAEALYEVRIIDNDYNTYQEVMEISILALGVSQEQAFAVAWEVDHLGSCVVAHAPKKDADEIAGLIRTIGIEVQVKPIGEAAC